MVWLGVWQSLIEGAISEKRVFWERGSWERSFKVAVPRSMSMRLPSLPASEAPRLDVDKHGLGLLARRVEKTDKLTTLVNDAPIKILSIGTHRSKAAGSPDPACAIDSRDLPAGTAALTDKSNEEASIGWLILDDHMSCRSRLK